MENLIKILSKPDNIPIAGMLLLVFFCLYIAMRQAVKNDRRKAQGKKSAEEVENDKVLVWPYLTRSEFLCLLMGMILLTVWSIGIDAPLEDIANSSKTPNPSKAPWYFLGLQEMLVYFDPWIAGVVLPTLIIIGLMAIPYIDTNKLGRGYYTFKERKFAITVFCFGFIVLWVFLIMMGTFLRGPGWNFFFPWERWDPHKVVALTNVNLTYALGIRDNFMASIFGAIVVGGYYFFGVIYYFVRKNKSAYLKNYPIKYAVTAFLFLSMMALPIKMFLRIAFNIKYVWVTPWFNI